jgi:hypothetical protein
MSSMRPRAAGERDILYRQKGGPSLKQMEAAAMRLYAYRDENRSGHVELMGGGDHPWSIDLVTVIAAAILVIGFAGALVAKLVL